MSSIADSLRSLFPDFEKARRERRKIRQRYRENIAAVNGHGNSEVVTINSRDYSPEYLTNWVEKKHVQANQLIKQEGSSMRADMYRLPDEGSSEVVEAMRGVTRRITVRNWLSIFVEILFVVFVVVSLSAAVFLALAGIDTLISDVGRLTGNTTAQLFMIYGLSMHELNAL